MKRALTIPDFHHRDEEDTHIFTNGKAYSIISCHESDVYMIENDLDTRTFVTKKDLVKYFLQKEKDPESTLESKLFGRGIWIGSTIKIGDMLMCRKDLYQRDTIKKHPQLPWEEKNTRR